MDYTALSKSELYATISGAYSEILDGASDDRVRAFIIEHFGSEDRAADLLGRVIMMTPAIDNYVTHQQEHLFEVVTPQRCITVAQRAQRAVSS